MFSITRIFHFPSCTSQGESLCAICMNILLFHLSRSGPNLQGDTIWLYPYFKYAASHPASDFKLKVTDFISF